MANIKVKLGYPIKDGVAFTFHAPCHCENVQGIVVEHPEGSTRFSFKDAHGHDLGDLNHLFAADAMVMVVLDVTNSAAYLQNADTNGYLEKQIGVERARVDELVARRATVGVEVFEFKDDFCTATIKTNGFVATLEVYVRDVSIPKYSSFDFRQIPKAFAPFNAQQDLTHSWGDDITVSIFDSEDDCTPLSITNMGELISVTGHCYVTYDLASMYCPELADLRVAYDGTIHNTAREAVSQQLVGLGEQCANVAYEQQEARTGYDGTTYGNVGTAIREQVAGLHNRITDNTVYIVETSDGAAESISVGDKYYDGFVDFVARKYAEDAKLLIVDYNKNNGTASHNAEQIYAHVENGGTAVFDYTGEYIALTFCDGTDAIFSSAKQDKTILSVFVTGGGNVRVEEQTYALEGEGGGSNVLVVTYNRETEMASHKAAAIYQHVQNGGTAVFNTGYTMLALTSCCEQDSVFCSLTDDSTQICKYVVSTGGRVYELYEYLATEDYVDRVAGSNVLIVTIDDDNTASHTAAEIYEHVQNGGSALLQRADQYFALQLCYPTEARFFEHYPDTAESTVISVYETGVEVYDHFYGGGGDSIKLAEIEQSIGDIDTALDAIIAIQEELIGGVQTITFYVDGVQYTAEDGMTWIEWIESEYNVDGFKTMEVGNPEDFGLDCDSCIFSGTNAGPLVVLDPWCFIDPHHIIDPNLPYTFD